MLARGGDRPLRIAFQRGEIAPTYGDGDAKARPGPFSTTISPPLAGVRPKPFKGRDVLEFLNLKGEYSEPDLAQGAFSSMQSMKARSAAGTWRRLG